LVAADHVRRAFRPSERKAAVSADVPAGTFSERPAGIHPASDSSNSRPVLAKSTSVTEIAVNRQQCDVGRISGRARRSDTQPKFVYLTTPAVANCYEVQRQGVS